MIKTNRGSSAHLAELALRKKDSLRNRGGRASSFERRIRATGEKGLGAMLAQVFAGRVEVAQLRWMFDAAHINAAFAKLLAIERRKIGRASCRERGKIEVVDGRGK